MDLFAAIMFGVVAAIVLAVVALGVWYPGSGAAQVGWRTPRQHADEEAARDSEDLEQMLEATNARRRARGEEELTVEALLAEERGGAGEGPGGGSGAGPGRSGAGGRSRAGGRSGERGRPGGGERSGGRGTGRPGG